MRARLEGGNREELLDLARSMPYLGHRQSPRGLVDLVNRDDFDIGAA
jgi:hypothetical protein